MLFMYGNTFSKLAEAGVTTQVVGFRPTNCALSRLMGLAGLPRAMHGFKASCLHTRWIRCRRPQTSDGIVSTLTVPHVETQTLAVTNQKSLSLIIGSARRRRQTARESPG